MIKYKQIRDKIKQIFNKRYICNKFKKILNKNKYDLSLFCEERGTLSGLHRKSVLDEYSRSINYFAIGEILYTTQQTQWGLAKVIVKSANYMHNTYSIQFLDEGGFVFCCPGYDLYRKEFIKKLYKIKSQRKGRKK